MSRLRKVGAFLGLVPDELDRADGRQPHHDDPGYHSTHFDEHGYDDHVDSGDDRGAVGYHGYDSEADYAGAEFEGVDYSAYSDYAETAHDDLDRTEQIPAYSGSPGGRQPLVTAGGGRGRPVERDYPVQGALAVQPEVRLDAMPDPVATQKPATITLTGFADAREVGETYRAGQAVILDMTDLTDAEARRMVDFAAGLAFAVRGSIDKVTQKVFMLHPPTSDLVNGG